MGIGLAVFPLTNRLRRAAYVERASIQHLCGWFIAARPYEVKHRFGYHVWDHAEHVEWLQERLRLLRGGLAATSLEPGLISFVGSTRHAPDEYAYIRGAYLVLKPALLELYEETLELCDPSANAYDIRLLNRIIPEVRAQIKWAYGALEGEPNPEQSKRWANALHEALEALGGLSCTGVSSAESTAELDRSLRFVVPDRLLFDERIGEKPLMPHGERLELPYEQGLREQFRVFFNEAYAAAMLASVLYDGFEHNLPWEFIRDFARHFWDECRHSEFGAVRLKELGDEPDRCDQRLFRNSLAMPLLHRVCYLTLVLEPYYMSRKKPRFEEYGRAGDGRSQLFADHDWSDEINHVRVGKEWLKRLLEEDARDVGQIKEETREILARLEGASVGQLSPF